MGELEPTQYAQMLPSQLIQTIMTCNYNCQTFSIFSNRSSDMDTAHKPQSHKRKFKIARLEGLPSGRLLVATVFLVRWSPGTTGLGPILLNLSAWRSTISVAMPKT